MQGSDARVDGEAVHDYSTAVQPMDQFWAELSF